MKFAAVVALLLLLLSGGGIMAYTATRGWRNNNPFNLRRTSDRWQGLAPDQSDPEFFRFADLQHGIRAGLIVLRNYHDRHGLNTVRAIVQRYAPPTENDTGAYVAAVARALDLGPDEPFNVPARIGELAAAIMRHENGVMHPQWKTALASGLTLAGYADQARDFA